MTESEQCDLITGFDVIHDQAKPDRVLANVRQALRPHRVFLMQDIAVHTGHWTNRDHPAARSSTP